MEECNVSSIHNIVLDLSLLSTTVRSPKSKEKRRNNTETDSYTFDNKFTRSKATVGLPASFAGQLKGTCTGQLLKINIFMYNFKICNELHVP